MFKAEESYRENLDTLRRRTATLNGLKELDREIYAFLVEKKEAVQRKVIVKKFGRKRTTVYDSLMRLLVKLLVKRSSVPRTTSGRPDVVWGINDEYSARFRPRFKQV